MAIDVTSLFLLEVFGIFVLIGFISWLIVFVNDNLTRLGMYHTLKTKYEFNGEGLFSKIFKVFTIYVSLFPFVYFSIYISLKFLPFSDINLGSQAIIKGGPLFTIVLLILMRLLMNPTYGNTETLLRLQRREVSFARLKLNAETFKERILTFFSSYISLTLIVFFFYLLVQYDVLVHNPTALPNIINSIFPSGGVPDEDTISALVTTYSALLILLTVTIEIVLWGGVPIIQTRWEVRKTPRPLTVESFEIFGLSKKDLILYYINKQISLVSNMPSEVISFFKLKLGNIKGGNRNS